MYTSLVDHVVNGERPGVRRGCETTNRKLRTEGNRTTRNVYPIIYRLLGYGIQLPGSVHSATVFYYPDASSIGIVHTRGCRIIII